MLTALKITATAMLGFTLVLNLRGIVRQGNTVGHAVVATLMIVVIDGTILTAIWL